MRITTNKLKSGLFLASVSHDFFSTSCTHKEKRRAISLAVKGLNEMLRLIGQEYQGKLSVFGVSAREKGKMDYWEVDVVADSVRNARRIGVDAIEADGLLQREKIGSTLVWEKIETVHI